MSMSNMEIIASEAMLIGYEYNGENLFTFAEWQQRGYKIIKGSTAIINTQLWKPVTRKDKETGAESKGFIMVKAALFSIEQVEIMSDKMKEYLNTKKQSKQTNKKSA